MNQSWVRTGIGLLAVLIGTLSVLSPAAFAQTDPASTERLNAQMQSAAATAAGRQPPAPPATPNANCTLIVPKNALSAA